MKIGVDIMGGDYAPEAALKGVAQALLKLPEDQTLSLIGNKDIITSYLQKENLTGQSIDIIESSNDILMGESPTRAFTQKQDSSIANGLKALENGSIDVFLSAGNTGAMLVGSMYTVKPINGITRPAITSILPKIEGGKGIIVDVGANADCKPETLFQFGLLASLYANKVFKLQNPRVSLLNIGSEPEKGNLTTQAAYKLFDQSEDINFIGNIEGYDLFNDKADIIVCDGFTGNVVLKTAEAFYDMVKMRNISDSYFDQYDYQNYGGTPILGLNKPVIIGHGVSSPTAFENMIMLARDVVTSNLTESIKQAFEK